MSFWLASTQTQFVHETPSIEKRALKDIHQEVTDAVIAVGPKPDPIAEMNAFFRSVYGMNRDVAMAEVPLAGLTLIGTGEIWRVEWGQLVRSYSPAAFFPKIKGLMHAVIGVYGAWGLALRMSGSQRSHEVLQGLDQALQRAVDFAGHELPENLATDSEKILNALHQLVHDWAHGTPPSLGDFPEMMEKVRPELDRIIRQVGEAMYGSLIQSLETFRAESSEQDWKNLYFGICGPAQGRRNNIEVAAASAIFGRNAIGRQVLYLENAMTIPDGLRLLASLIIEKDLGLAVFNDPYRMWEDVLSDTAVKHMGGGFFLELGPGRE